MARVVLLRIATGALIAALMGCGGGESVVFVPRPDDVAGAASILVLVSDPDGAVGRFDRAGAEVLELPVAHWGGRAPETAQILVAYYDATLESLGVSAGRVRPGIPLPCVLGEPRETVQARLTRGRPGPWGAAPDAEVTVRSYLFPDGAAACTRPDRCATFAVDVVQLPVSRPIEALAPYDDRTALVGGIDGDYFLVSRSGDVTAQPQLQGFPDRALARDPQGRYWFGGSDGRVRRGPITGPFDRLDVSAGTVAWIAPHPTEDRAVAVLAMTSTEAPDVVEILERARGEWRSHGREEVPELSLSRVRAAWVADDQLLATYGGQTMFHLDRGTLRTVIVGFANPLFDLDVNAVTPTADGAALIAGGDGRVYRSEPPFDSWIAFPDAALAVQVESVTETPEGFLFGGSDGLIGQYVRGSAPCRAEHLSASDSELIVPIGGAYAVSGGVFGDRSASTVTWLEPVRR